MNPYDVRIGFSASKGIGDIIRLATGGSCNHAFVLWYDPIFQCELTLGANSNGLTIEALQDFPDEITDTFRPLKGELSAGLQKNIDWLNKPYDYAGLLGMAEVEALRRIANIKAKNPFLDAHKLFCSRYATMVVRDSGYPILPSTDDGTIDPNQLCQAMLAQPTWFEHIKGF